MVKVLTLIQSIGASFGPTLEHYRDPLLIACSLVLVVVALSYLLIPSVRFTVDTLLAVKIPTGFKHVMGGLLILLPGVFILATVYFEDVTRAIEKQWPGLVEQYVSKRDLPQKGAVQQPGRRSNTSRKQQVRRAAANPVATQDPTQTTTRAGNEPIGDPSTAYNSDSYTDWSAVASNTNVPYELQRKQAARRKLVERRLREDSEERRKRNANVWLTKQGEVAAMTEQLLDEASSYLKDQDFQAFNRLAAAQRAFRLKDGEKVSIIKYEYTTGKVKVKLLSTNMEFWTFRKSLKKES